ncbi:5-methylthioadenosine/S-adenosylhomocysteine deaminase MtaD [Gottschalkia acidurici 9a]|uniref:5-methylthioadenosine/S-adenosylhomocysteine deaminase n=1 Tax=Gottschalkia acidurici (strain ATCC 7906 / DSM 604 / BCRC 14475 / CIP 104303 / KCTC 5404 / NCIMB 10678 / 9a) TaxID=1128398 RepID=K0B0N9_GOTA9|nr:amidohydrolase [Gottschalkia acidurici]AFS79094.1 5-methylthioadenosine/S-adenosylhomocysteine deaminase MtaD [Gottschalkia acidurici 9a]
MNILIKGTNLITMNENKDIKENIDIAIEGNRIKYIGEIKEDFKVDKVIDGTNKITMPGLVNTHTHIPMSLFRNYADDLPFWEWLHEKILPLEKGLSGDHVYWGSMLSIAEMLSSGITTFVDMYFFMDDISKAVEETGIRGCLALSLSGNEITGESQLIETKKFIEKWNGKANGRIKTRIAPHAPYSCTPEFLNQIISLAKEYNQGINIHVSESKKEMEDSYKLYGKSPIEHINDLGLFDVPTIAVHCVQLSDRDINILKEKEVTVANNPGSNLKLANGFARVDALLKAGVNVTLGTDGSASNNNLNMFEEMNLAALINKGVTEDPLSVPAYTALEMATINGAKAIGLEDEIGSIEIGKKADIIMIDINKPHFYPRYNLISSLVYSAQASDVDTVIIDGEILMEEKKLKTIDVESVMKKCRKDGKGLT